MLAQTERDNAPRREELNAAKGYNDKLVTKTRSLKDDMIRSQELNEVLGEQPRILKRDIQLLKGAELSGAYHVGGPYARARRYTCICNQSGLGIGRGVVKMLEELSSEIFETGPYIVADSFIFQIG